LRLRLLDEMPNSPSQNLDLTYLLWGVLTMSNSKCCTAGFDWEGEPTGQTVSFPTSSNQAYKTGTSSAIAILFICDLFGWEFRNNRLLADHLARSVGATIYVPDL
jgi:hypothetical protein